MTKATQVQAEQTTNNKEMGSMLNAEVKALIEGSMQANELKGTEHMYTALAEKLVACEVDPSNKNAVTAFLISNAHVLESVQEYAAPYVSPMAELAGDLHDGLVAVIKETGSFTDTFMWVALQAYGGRSPEHAVFAAKVARVFDNDKAEFGEYIREQLDVKKKLRIRDTALFTADTVRTTGDLAEKALVATVKALNKVAFQLPAKGIDATVRRPEELSHINIVKQGVNHPFKKESVADIAARIVDEKKMAEVKKKKAGAISKLRKQKQN